jgi:hypothetical protein
MSAEDTDLERRVLAHEQILQALIAHMVETEPKFLDRLSATFSHPVHMDAEHPDRTGTADYAALFVREVIKLGATDGQLPPEVSRWDDLWPTRGEINLVNENVPVRFEVRLGDELWEVLRNGRLFGGYVSRAGALESAQMAVHDVFCSGASAELLTLSPRGRA